MASKNMRTCLTQPTHTRKWCVVCLKLQSVIVIDIVFHLRFLSSSRIYSCVNFVLFLILMWRFDAVKYCIMPINKFRYAFVFWGEKLLYSWIIGRHSHLNVPCRRLHLLRWTISYPLWSRNEDIHLRMQQGVSVAQAACVICNYF